MQMTLQRAREIQRRLIACLEPRIVVHIKKHGFHIISSSSPIFARDYVATRVMAESFAVTS